MIIDGIDRVDLLLLVKQAFLDANTAAGGRVDLVRDWPTSPEEFPMILLQAPRERKVSIMPGMLTFNTTVSVAAVGRAVGRSLEEVRQSADNLCREMVHALLLNPTLQHQVQQFAVIDTQIVLSAETKYHIGEVGMSIDMVVYQAYGAKGVPLTSISGDVSIASGTPGDAPEFTVEMLPTGIIQNT